jgi:hypothetical protein
LFSEPLLRQAVAGARVHRARARSLCAPRRRR